MNVRLHVLGWLALLLSSAGVAQEPAACLASGPRQWPEASKPYFLVIADSSGSMTTTVGTPSSCGLGNSRNAHARCALRSLFETFDGVAQFGLATFPVIQANCPVQAQCASVVEGATSAFGDCSYFVFQSEINSRGTSTGCGPIAGTDVATASGATIRAPIVTQNFWTTPPFARNNGTLLQWSDNVCSNQIELFAVGYSPLNGSLRDAKRYFAGNYVMQDGLTAFPSPLATQDLSGTGVNGSTACRSVHVILVADGDENCDTQAAAVGAATDLYANGVTVGGKNFKVRVHVINLIGGTQSTANQIAAAGGTGSAILVANESQLTQAFTTIVTGALSAERGDNIDNDCNGCTDEGYAHYSNTNPTCCAWGNAAQRNTCLNTYAASISPANPQGNRTLLPCTSAAQAAQPANWLTYNPGETCDGTDNNGDGQIDEGQLKCGFPPACPSADICNGRDDDCDGVVDEGCPVVIGLSPEICDGCDNDGNGLTDDGVVAVACGFPAPANCVGSLACKPAQPVQPGACVVNGGYQSCNNSPQAEACDGLDNNCNGIVDDGIAPLACTPPGQPLGLVFGGSSQCRQGQQFCGQSCSGFVGPTAEVCDGIDNDCNGTVDQSAVDMGTTCGVEPGLVYDQVPSQCRSGLTACVSAEAVCQGNVGPSTEIVGDGVDNNCNGLLDETDIFRDGFE